MLGFWNLVGIISWGRSDIFKKIMLHPLLQKMTSNDGNLAAKRMDHSHDSNSLNISLGAIWLDFYFLAGKIIHKIKFYQMLLVYIYFYVFWVWQSSYNNLLGTQFADLPNSSLSHTHICFLFQILIFFSYLFFGDGGVCWSSCHLPFSENAWPDLLDGSFPVHGFP